ncbi:MAG: hypothetical protein ABFD20_05790 [Anaerolineales bacterium]
MAGPKHMSEKQLTANCVNTQHSPGPRTREGRAAVHYNALKHGILAQAIIPEALEPYESCEDFDELLTELHTEFNPSGVLEELLVEQIATAYWRLARVYRAEADAIAARQNNSQHGREPLYRLRHTPLFPTGMSEQGQLSNQLELLLTNKRSLRSAMSKLDPTLRGATDEEIRACAEALLVKLRERAVQDQHHHQAVASAVNSLPHLDAALKSAHYEASLQNQLDRALSRLERLRRLRGGEFVAPPLEVEVSQIGDSANDLP